MDCSPPGSSVQGILQARILKWVAISFSNAWKWKAKVKALGHARVLVTPWTAAYQAPSSMGFSRQEYWSGVPSPSPNMLSRLVITFLSRSKRLWISWLQSPSAVISQTPQNKVWHCFHCFPVYFPWSDGTGCHDLRFLNVELLANIFALLFHFHQVAF